MTKPVGCRDLTPKQLVTFNKLMEKEEPNEKDLETLLILRNKRLRFNDPPLSAAAKKHLLTRYSWEKYNKGTISTHTKRASLTKGNDLENEAFIIVGERDKIIYETGDDFIYNDFIYGKCDLFNKEKNKIVDTKVSWGIHTYLPNHTTKLSSKHWFQMQGYMEL